MESYRRLGQEPVISILPKSRVGNEVAVGPAIDHQSYLRNCNTGSHRERFRDNSVRIITTANGGTEMLTVPKSSYVETPGSVHLMLIAVGKDKHGAEKPIPAFADIPNTQGEEHFRLLADIASTLPARYGQKWFIGTSVNPDEWKRQAVQSVKTIHTHIVGMNGETFIPFSEVGKDERAERRRALADSATALGSALLREVVFTADFWRMNQTGIVSEIDVRPNTQYPKGYIFALPAIEAIGDPRFAALTKAIDDRMRSEYKIVAGLFSIEGSKDILGRPILKPPEERATKIYAYAAKKGLSFTTYQRLMRLSSRLVSSMEEVAQAGDDIDAQTYRANTRLFLKGRAYNHMIFPDQDGSGKIFVAIVPRGLSGGSPLDAMGIYKEQYLVDRPAVQKVIQQNKQVAAEIADQAMPEISYK